MTVIENLTNPGTAPIVGAVITAAVTVNSMFLKWLIKSFSDLRDSIRGLSNEVNNLSKEYRLLLDSHEEKDQYRHEENLKRFETIAVSLAKIDK